MDVDVSLPEGTQERRQVDRLKQQQSRQAALRRGCLLCRWNDGGLWGKAEVFGMQTPSYECRGEEAEPSDLVSPTAVVGENRPEQRVCALRKGRGNRKAEGRKCV